jgi:hypothetical protein
MILAGGSGASGEFVDPTPPSGSAGSGSGSSMFAVSAGLDVVSGVFGYLNARIADQIAQTRANMIRQAAQANAQRYMEKANADIAQQKVMYLASGVTLSGSPLDVLDDHIRLAQNDAASIIMAGNVAAVDQSQSGANALNQGRNALIGGLAAATDNIGKATRGPAYMQDIYARGATS